MDLWIERTTWSHLRCCCLAPVLLASSCCSSCSCGRISGSPFGNDLAITDVARFLAHATLHIHGHPAASNRRCGRRTGEEVHVHVPHCTRDVRQREFAISYAISSAGVPHELVFRRKGGEDHVTEVAVGDLLPHLIQAVPIMCRTRFSSFSAALQRAASGNVFASLKVGNYI